MKLLLRNRHTKCCVACSIISNRKEEEKPYAETEERWKTWSMEWTREKKNTNTHTHERAAPKHQRKHYAIHLLVRSAKVCRRSLPFVAPSIFANLFRSFGDRHTHPRPSSQCALLFSGEITKLFQYMMYSQSSILRLPFLVEHNKFLDEISFGDNSPR